VAEQEQSEGERVSRREFLMQVSKRTGISVKTVTHVYDTMLDELMDTLVRGDQLTLTGFGKFYSQPHKGHRVQFAGGGSEVINDYRVLKFSATRAVNRSLAQEPKPRPERLTDGTEPDSGDDDSLFEVDTPKAKRKTAAKAAPADTSSGATSSTRAKNRSQRQVLDIVSEVARGEKMI